MAPRHEEFPVSHDPVSHDIAPALLAWAETELRDLPWRHTRDPWHILVSETMLQQTQVSRVIERYRVFLERFPTPACCAAAPVSTVIELWAGLGYNRRAVNLWRAAGVVTDQHGGQVPAQLDVLLALPGVGPYTARAIQAFAFEQDVAVLDTNVGRLLARWSDQSLKPTAAQLLADTLVPAGHGWVWNQSLFDFAVAVCTKREPRCGDCPLVADCRWQGSGPDPAANSAGVAGKQSTFAGSERQVRGRIVDALRVSPIPVGDLIEFGRATDTPEDIQRIADGLVADGLAARLGNLFTLPTH